MKPQRDDYNKLIGTVQYIRGTQNLGVTFEVHEPIHVIAYIDASFAIHPDMKSHTGCVITLGKGAIYAKSGIQRLMTKSSTEAELVAICDSANQVLWTRNFLRCQGHHQPPALIHEDNQSTIQLIRNGRSNSERTRHVDIRYFFLHDRMSTGDIDIQYLPTKEMITYMLTKPLQGELFRKLRKELINHHPTVTYAANCKPEERTDNTVTCSRPKTNPNFQYPSKPTTTYKSGMKTI